MEMPKPTDAHKKLARLVGTWTGEEKMHPSPWDPKGGTAMGKITNRLALGGFAVIQEYRQERGGQTTFEGHGVFSYDAARQDYLLHWFDSMGTPPNEFRGRFEGQVLTLFSESPQGRSRAIFDLGGDGTYTFKMDMSPDGRQWQTLMEGGYRKA